MSDESPREVAAEAFETAAHAARDANDEAVVENVNRARLALREARQAEQHDDILMRWERGP